MLDVDIRTAILQLSRAGHGIRTIAQALKISRQTVRRVLASGTAEVPGQQRPEKAQPHEEFILQLHASCKGNLVRVQEELAARGIAIAYSTLTGFCRRHGIGVKKKKRAGRYHFEPGEEMQHDTSPHDVVVGGKKRRLQCTSVVLCFSRMIFMQLYLTFNRFWCKVFLTEALRYFAGAASRCMVDNTSVVVARGTGKNAVMAPEMEAFGKRFGFAFAAHEKGDANRSARVEGPFWYVERNFYPGRTFSDLADLNRQAIAWCERANRKHKRPVRAIPLELYQIEKPHLQPLPLHIPEVYRVHHPTVDLEGYIHLHTNRYSVDEDLIGRRVEVRESKDRVRVFVGHKQVADHERQEDGRHKRRTLPQHRHAGRRGKKGQAPGPMAEEKTLRAADEVLSKLSAALRTRHGGRAARQIKRLHRMYIEYPTQALRQAVEEALAFGLYDLERIERMVLRYLAGEFFRLPVEVRREEKIDQQEDDQQENDQEDSSEED